MPPRPTRAPTFQLQPKLSELREIASRYSYSLSDDALADRREEIRARGHLNKEDLQAVGRWKSPRSAGRIDANPDQFVVEVTGLALAAQNERTRIEVLTVLSGVAWPTASVILHFFHSDQYPILDYRALEALGVDSPQSYDFVFWHRYVEFTRGLAKRREAGSEGCDLASGSWPRQRASARCTAARARERRCTLRVLA